MKFVGHAIVAILLSCCALSAQAAEWTPFQLSLVNPVQLFPEESRVQGVRINLLYGVNREVDGLDYGPVNRTTGTTQGVQTGAFPFGGINITGDLYGMQVGGVLGGLNIAGGEVHGVQISGIFAGINRAGNVSGVQLSGIIGGINKAENVSGVQIAGTFLGVNLAKNVQGFQLGTIYNQAGAMEGLQLGLVNVCSKMQGVQIGLVNVIKENNIPFFPIVNGRF
ncbi:MAG TPA: hypothetical protein VIH45_03645 [Desulfuromonadaceae bacterium]